MAHDADPSMALADVYAEAMLSTALEQGGDEALAAEFADFVEYLDRDAEFERFLTADSVDDDPRRASLEKLFRGRMNDLLLNLLLVLNDRRRMELVRGVQRCVQLRMEAKKHQQEVVVETAIPLNDVQKADICRDVGKQIGKEVLLVEEVRPELIGGVIIHVDDIQVDGSVSSQLKRTQRQLMERATVAIHSGRGYVEET